jgi:hypothetical protein
MAQSPVYSVNIVGYINKTLNSGLSLVANQLNASPDNSVATLMPNPGAVTVYKFVGSSFVGNAFDLDNGWGDPTMPLAPGEGFFIDNATGGPLQLTFVGEVALSKTVNLTSGLGIYSSTVPKTGTLDSTPGTGLGFPAPTDNITVYKWTGSGYDGIAFDLDNGWPGPGGAGPTLNISEAVFIDSAIPIAWTQTLTVGP